MLPDHFEKHLDDYQMIIKKFDSAIALFNGLQKNKSDILIAYRFLLECIQELADYIKHPLRYENTGISPEKGILLTGPSQTGKSYFAQALKTLIESEAGQNSDKVKFMYITL